MIILNAIKAELAFISFQNSAPGRAVEIDWITATVIDLFFMGNKTKVIDYDSWLYGIVIIIAV